MKGLPFLAWAHILLIWSAAAYCVRDPMDDERERATRGWYVLLLIRATLGAFLSGMLSSSASMAALVFSATVVLPIVRSRLPSRYCTELEIGTNVLVVAVSLLLVSRGPLTMGAAAISLPMSNERIAACIIAALFLFTINGGTYVVRGLLKKTGAVPKTPPSEGSQIDVGEFNRGRLIGALERVLLFAVVIAGSYEALGFVVAAKGLIRSREFEQNRDMTEYFLIGSLASVLVALGAGLVARLMLNMYW